MTIFYVGSADWESEINVQIEAGTPPDISIFPQPGKLADFARDGFVVPLPDDVTAAVSENWSAGAMGFGNVDGTQYGVPDKTDLKSLVWYQPARFEANGYKVPTTLDELFGLAETMIADGNTPFCIGIESGTATGWTFTDWVEDMMLRRHSGETYDAWTTGELLFASDEVSGVMQEVLDVWNTPGMVYAQGGTIASTSFRDNGEPLVNGDCMMHRQASFFSAFFPDGTPVQDGSEGAIDVFQFPARRHRSSDRAHLGHPGRCVQRQARGHGRDGVLRFAGVRQPSSGSAEGSQGWWRRPLGLQHRQPERRPFAVEPAGAELPRDHGEQRRALRRLGPHAGRRRRRLVLDRGHGARQR